MAINKRLIKSNDEAAGGASFNTVTYTGTGVSTPITGVGFQPDFVWIKGRTLGASHQLTDSVRTAPNALKTNRTDAEDSEGVSSFDSDGFTLQVFPNENGDSNTIGQDYVAWCWKAGGAAVTNTDGTITSQVSANPAAGFSIVSYTGNGITTGQSFGHGLGVVPNMIIVKNRTTSGTGWNVLFPEFMTSGQYMALNQTKGITNSANSGWGGSLPDSSKVFVGGSSWTNTNGNAYISYVFAEVAGFSKFGSYTMNTSELIVDVGFEPAFVMVKEATRAASWVIIDNKRLLSGDFRARLFPDLSNAESSGLQAQISGNTFRINYGTTGNNDNGGTGIYMAFANQF